MDKAILAARLEMMSKLMDLLGEDSFKAAAHARAARAVDAFGGDMGSLDRAGLLEIDGIGQKMADKILEFGSTGRIKELDELMARVPQGVLALTEIPGLGPKTARVMWQEGGITSIDALKKGIEDGSVQKLPRMGAKSVERIKAAMATVEQGAKRLNLGIAMPIAERVVAHMLKVKGVTNAAFAGSLRRGKDTIGDIDILVTAKTPEAGIAAGEAFRTMPGVQQILIGGESKSSVMMARNMDELEWGEEAPPGNAESTPTPTPSKKLVQVDLRVVPEAAWGAALAYFTGSKEHNVALRERSIKMGFRLNEYGLFKDDGNDEPPQHRGLKPAAAATEESIYKALKLPYVPPELREDQGELALKETPTLIEVADIKAELHAHTTASDGVMSIEELAAKAKERGFHTIAVTDHSQSSTIANGLRPDRLRQHIENVRKAAEKVKGITILTGSEVDILADGTLDYKDDLLRELDVVVASPHASLSQDPETATARLLKAIRHPLVHILGHPTGRIVNKRAGLSPDMGQLIAAAKEHNVALEINAHFMRLDLRDTHVRDAVKAGALIAIDCDVHHQGDYDNLRYGILTARRGRLTPEGCINTWPAAKLHKWLKAKR